MTRQAGSAAPVMLAVAGLVLLLGMAVADAGLLLAGRHRAGAAADAAALAAAPVTFRPFGAAGTARLEAARFAAINGASLVSCRCHEVPGWHSRTVEVVVEVPVDLLVGGAVSVRARSSAEFDPLKLLSPRG